MSEERLAETLERLHSLVNPILDREGLELVDLEYKRQGRRYILRIFIDKADRVAYRGAAKLSEDEIPGEEVSIDDCTRVSRELSPLLDVEDLIPVAYHLEVSSPGVNRPLKTPRHFKLAEGLDVRIKTRVPIEPTKETFFIARLVQAGEEGVVLDVRGTTVECPYRLISQANVEYRF